MWHIVSWQKASNCWGEISTLLAWFPQSASGKGRLWYTTGLAIMASRPVPSLCSLCLTGRGLVSSSYPLFSSALTLSSSVRSWWPSGTVAKSTHRFVLDSSSHRFCRSSYVIGTTWFCIGLSLNHFVVFVAINLCTWTWWKVNWYPFSFLIF